MSSRDPKPGRLVTTPPRSIFISYAPNDALALVQRVAKDLGVRSGHRVWIDRERIEGGARWAERIEKAIQECSFVVAVLTPQSLRESSVCRKEIQFAAELGRTIIPLRASSRVGVSHPLPLPLAGISWIDFTGRYEAGLQSLLDAIQRPKPDSDARPLDFGVEISKYSSGFQGRGWVTESLDAWLATDDAPGGFVIVAEPGVGKSSFAGFLSRRRDVVAAYFCTNQNTRSLDPGEFVTSLVHQLSMRLPAFAAGVQLQNPARRRMHAGDAFRELIVDVVRALPATSRRKIILVDSLDEAMSQSDETIVDVLLRHLPDLPPWLRVVATTRPEVSLMRRVRHLNVFNLEADSSSNLQDLREYVCHRLEDAHLKNRYGNEVEALAEQIEAIAEGNFLCARFVLDSLMDGTITPASLSGLAPGLAVFFFESFRRHYPVEENYRKLAAPVLGALVAARAPLPGQLLSSVLSGEIETAPSLQWLSVLRPLRVYLRETVADGCASYSLFHKALGDWLTNEQAAGEFRVRVADGHQALARCIWREYQQQRESLCAYASRHLPIHFAEAGYWDELLRIVSEGRLKLLERWTEREPQEGLKCLAGLIARLQKPGGDLQLAAGYATQLARIHSRLDRFEEAEHCLLEALKWCRSPKARRTRAIAYHELGSLAMYRGDAKASERLYRRALFLCERHKPRFDDEASANLVAFAVLSLGRSDYKSASAQASRALKFARESNDLPHCSAANRLLANVAKDHLRFPEAMEHLQAASLIAGLHDLPFEKAAISHLKGWLYYGQAALQNDSPRPAIEMFDQAIVEANRIGHLPYRVGALLGLSQCHLLQGSLDTAELRCGEAQRALLDSRRHADLEVCLRLVQASVALNKRQVEIAKEGFKQTAKAARAAKETSREADAWVGIGAAEFHAGRVSQAETGWRKAQAIARNCSPLRLQLVLKGIERNAAGGWCAPL